MGFALNAVIDFIYPPRCSFCGHVCGSEEGICEDCLSQIHYIDSPLCTRCGKPFPHDFATDHFCGECVTRKRFFSKARAVGVYNGIFRKALHRFKYQWRHCLATPLGTLMAKHMETFFSDGTTYHVIVPVPLHPRRLRQRGYNQCDYIAEGLSGTLGIPWDNGLLSRVSSSSSQTAKSRPERWESLDKAFQVRDPWMIDGKHILLIDDVVTTGSTLEACADEILGSGSTRVSIATLAYTGKLF